MKRSVLSIISVIWVCCVFAQNEKGLGGLNPVSYQVGSNRNQEKPTCYVVTIGVDSFNDNSRIPFLKYPDSDCKKFFEAVKYYFTDDYVVIEVSLPAEKTKRTTRKVLEIFNKVRDKGKGGDIVMLYLSGHGKTEYGEYYFPMYDSNYSPILDMLTGRQIAEFATQLSLKGANVLVFLDTCESGGIIDIPITTSGPGNMAFFPASAKDRTISESPRESSSSYGTALCRIMKGISVSNQYMDKIIVGDIGDQLQNVSEGNQQPRYINAPGTDFSKTILISGLKERREYKSVLYKYTEYINSAKSNLKNKKFDEVLRNLESAGSLECKIHKEDVDSKGLQSIKADLNKAIASICNKPDYSSDIWKSLAVINEKSPYLDTSVVNMATVFLHCGYYYKEKGENEIAYNMFEKANKQGDHKYAPYELAQLYQVLHDDLDTNEKKMVQDHYLEAANTGNKAAYQALNSGDGGVIALGTVSDSDGNPIAGVTVECSGSTSKTDEGGRYYLVVSDGSKLRFYCKGYHHYTVDVQDYAVISSVDLGPCGIFVADVTLTKPTLSDRIHDLAMSLDFDYGSALELGAYSSFKPFQIGPHVSFSWNCFQFGLDISLIPPLIITPPSPINEIIDDDNKFKYTKASNDYLEYNYSPVFFWSIGGRAGLYFKYVSLNCGVGYITPRASVSSSYPACKTDLTTGESSYLDPSEFVLQQKYYEVNSTYYVAPGVNAYIPIGDENTFISIGCRYRIVPTLHAFDGFEASLCVRFDLDY